MFVNRVTGAGVLLAQRFEALLGFFGIGADGGFFIVVHLGLSTGRCADGDFFVADVKIAGYEFGKAALF